MAAKEKTSTSAKKFRHPTAGNVQHDNHYLAIMWSANADKDNKTDFLKKLSLTLASTGEGEKGPLLQVNQTERLSWVTNKDCSKPIEKDELEKLENNDLVEWVSVAFKSAKAKTDLPELFAINPTRFYIKDQVIDNAGGLAPLGTNLGMDSQRKSRLPGWSAVRVDDANSAHGNTAVEAAQKAEEGARSKEGVDSSDIIRFENIPFLSPTCHTGGCKIPTGEFTPNDPKFALQWGLQRVEIPRAWEITQGSPDVTVAVIDLGVELTHPDLNMHPLSWNATTDTADGNPTGDHGTAVAGIIGAQFDNGQGVAGAASGVRIMAIATVAWADVDIAEGLYFAADNGARIVNMSFGVYDSWGIWDFDLIRDALQYAHDKGLLLIAASGNENISTSRFPGSDSRTLTVGGSNRSDERKRVGDASSENWWGACYGSDLDIVAPCIEMPTTDRLGAAGYNNASDYYDFFNGTSSATPLVSGLAGLIFSLRPNLTNVDVRNILQSSCDKISPALYTYANDNAKPSGTWNNEVGYGRVNAERALLQACAIDQKDDTECMGCGGDCVEETPPQCSGPKPIPWLRHDRCMYFYESRMFDLGPVIKDLVGFQIRVTYQHCLTLVGRQQGPLLYTTTLLPGEKVRLYEFDRYRRIRSETQRMSIQASFRQTISAMTQLRFSASGKAYFDLLNNIRSSTDASMSAGGGLVGFLGGPEAEGSSNVTTETTLASGASIQTASESFTQFATTASASVEAERSTVISTYEDEENRSSTARSLKNRNNCYAVTYFIRRVNELYESSSQVTSVEWRFGDAPWRAINDLDGLAGNILNLIDQLLYSLPRVGDETQDTRQVTIPTDGTVYESELAHCSSCEPERSAEQQIKLELDRAASRKACLEAELLALELERRRHLATGSEAVALNVGTWSLTSDLTTREDTKLLDE